MKSPSRDKRENESYQCVMIKPPDKKILKSQKYKLICEIIKVEGFSVGKNGKEIPNGIAFIIPTKIIGIEWPKKRSKRPKRKQPHND